MFYIGQEVVSLTNKRSNNGCFLRKGQIYTIKNITNCCIQNIDVGHNDGLTSVCQDCNHSDGSGTVWYHSTRFAPIVSSEKLQRLLNEIEEPIIAFV